MSLAARDSWALDALSSLERTRMPMLIMPANNTHWLVFFWQAKYGNLGHLYSPDRKENPNPVIPYVIDNGAWSAFKHNRPWCPVAYRNHVDRYAYHALRPKWGICPDVVGDRDATLRQWDEWSPWLRRLGIKTRLAVQNGMTSQDVRNCAPDGICIGGDSTWKWGTVDEWCAEFPGAHVLRANTDLQLIKAYKAGADSVDGTGYFRGNAKQIFDLGVFLAWQTGHTDYSEILRQVHYSRFKNVQNLALQLEEVA